MNERVKVETDEELVELAEAATQDEPVETTLLTDQRVLARVTDGIYRQPASALRELISNAYDADASRITIRTERPDFRRMSITDDGNGMSLRALVRLLRHIGGSSKRTSEGADYGITSKEDPTKSPGGRKLIGKIGIGLFSVSQLTSSFYIVTTRKKENYRSVASVILKQYSDDNATTDNDEKYEAGIVQVWTEPARAEEHGTTIVLDAIRPQTRETLQSIERWSSVFAEPDNTTTQINPPRYHVGVLDRENPELLKTVSIEDDDDGRADSHYFRMPWSSGVEGTDAMRALVDSLWGELANNEPNPSTENTFDNYLRLIWTLSQAAPLPYVDGHPFDLTGDSGLRLYGVTWEPGVQAAEIEAPSGKPVRELAGLGDTVRDVSGFEVWVDEVSLLRPMKFRDLPITSAALEDTSLFVSTFREDFPEMDLEMSGGPLAFQAYFLVAPKIVPADNRGVKIRVNEASGLGFDPKFMDFPVAERHRLSQISCEIFVTHGFDGALNIDRESYNYAHMHVRTVRRWLHETLKKVIAQQKRLEASARRARRERDKNAAFDKADQIVAALWERRANVTGGAPPPIAIATHGDSKTSLPGGFVFDERVVGTYTGPNHAQRRSTAEQLVVGVARILSAYGLLEGLSQEEREELLTALRELAQELK